MTDLAVCDCDPDLIDSEGHYCGTIARPVCAFHSRTGTATQTDCPLSGHPIPAEVAEWASEGTPGVRRTVTVTLIGGK